jgi:hypothetical protein
VYGTFFSPRLSALFRKAGWTSRISAGQGFFAPTALTEETEAAGLTRLLLPAPLKSERGRNASVDLSRSIGPVSVTVTFFASNIDHPVYVDRGMVYEIINLLGPTRTRGAELLTTYRKAPFFVTATYTYVRANELEPLVGRVDVPLTPRQNFGIVGMWEKEGSTRIGLESYYTGEQRLEYNPYRDVSRPYVLVGVLGERKIAAHVKLFLNLENLTNVRQTRWDPLLLPNRESDGRSLHVLVVATARAEPLNAGGPSLEFQIKQGHESVIHVKLLVAVEQCETRIISGEVDLHLLISADHRHIFLGARGLLASDCSEFERMPMQVNRVDVVARIPHTQSVTLTFSQMKHRICHHAF